MGGLVRGQVVSAPKWEVRLTETIHSGHFMVSDFEPESEAQDEEYEVGMPIPEPPPPPPQKVTPLPLPPPPPHAPIDGSLAKLFQCMTLAYRQKLTSPKWNRFKGVRLRWKDKIRLNNVIWRCWHMQFIMKKKTLVCQFASPLDVDAHNKPEAVVMEGKYWKRKLSTVAAEYKKWRLFYRNRIMGWTHNVPSPELHPVSLDGFDWNRSGTFGSISSMIFDDDLLMDFTDTLFSSLSSNQPFAFPNPREIARAGIADFIQPGLVQLQPNLEDFMDTLEPLQDYVNSKLLPPVPEELESFEPPDSLLSDDILPGGGGGGVVGKEKGAGRGPFVPTSFTFGGGALGEKGRGNSRHDLFAKPVGKPRGRSRSGGGGGGGGGGSSGRAPPTPHLQHHQQQQQQQQLHHSSAAPSTSTSSNSNSSNGGGNGSSMVNSSNTLLSHLLTNSAGSGQFSSGQKMGGGLHTGPGLNLMLSPTEGRVESGGGGGGQPSSQPSGRWSPKSDSLANLPINFGMGLGGSEGGSPPGVPSPPMGPPFSSGPSAPAKPFRPKSDTDRVHYKEHRRVCHINAEQKRRCNIKNGFDTLHSLIPQLSHNPNAKVSKAAMLQKGADYIRQLKLERAQLKEEIENHRQQVDNLNTAINSCQSMLPATGAPVSRQRTNKMKEMFEHWIRIRTNENWKFWIFSILIRPLLDSYNNSVSTASVDELCRTVLAWVDQHCSLVDLRPVVLNSLRYLCTTTDVLSNPANLPEEAYKAISQPIPPPPPPPPQRQRDSKGDQR